MSATAADPALIRQAYRRLRRAAMAAVMYSAPNRHMVAEALRRGFRSEEEGAGGSDSSSFQPQRVGRTVQFLEGAARNRGLEHVIVRNICHVRYWQRELERDYWRVVRRRQRGGGGSRHELPVRDPIAQQGYANFDDTIRMLNETFGLCLR